MLIQFGEVTLATVLTDLGSIFTAMVGFVGSICETIVSTPILLLGFGISFAFAIISLVKRLW